MPSSTQAMQDLDLRTVRIVEVFDPIVSQPAKVLVGSPLEHAVRALVDSSQSRKVYIVDDAGKLVGTITIEMLMRQLGHWVDARAPGVMSFVRFLGDIEKDNVEEFATRPSAVQANSRLIDAIQRMVEDGLSDLPVVDEDGVLVGELRGLRLVEQMAGVF